VRTYTAVVERGPATSLYVGHVPGFPGAHSQGASLDELRANLEEGVAMLLEDGEPALEAEFVGLRPHRTAAYRGVAVDAVHLRGATRW